MKSTMIELIPILETALQNARFESTKGRLERIIRMAKVGYYHNFKSNLAFPKKELATDLFEITGLEVVAQAVVDGEFDEEPDEEDKQNMRKVFMEGKSN